LGGGAVAWSVVQHCLPGRPGWWSCVVGPHGLGGWSGVVCQAGRGWWSCVVGPHGLGRWSSIVCQAGRVDGLALCAGAASSVVQHGSLCQRRVWDAGCAAFAALKVRKTDLLSASGGLSRDLGKLWLAPNPSSPRFGLRRARSRGWRHLSGRSGVGRDCRRDSRGRARVPATGSGRACTRGKNPNHATRILAWLSEIYPCWDHPRRLRPSPSPVITPQPRSTTCWSTQGTHAGVVRGRSPGRVVRGRSRNAWCAVAHGDVWCLVAHGDPLCPVARGDVWCLVAHGDALCPVARGDAWCGRLRDGWCPVGCGGRGLAAVVGGLGGDQVGRPGRPGQGRPGRLLSATTGLTGRCTIFKLILALGRSL
jgi:hypothetical protein